MSLKSIRVAFETHLALISNSFDTARENTEYSPVDNVPFQKIQLVPSIPENPTIGDDYYREEGEFQIFLNYPLNEGMGDITDRAEAVRLHFKRGTTLVQGNLRIVVKRTPQIAGASKVGNRLICPVIIKYFSDVF